MGFEFVEYEVLKQKILESIGTLAKKYKYNAKGLIDSYLNNTQNIKLLAKKYQDISKERRTEVEILLITIRCLDLSTSIDKTMCLNAAAFYIVDLIEKSYDPNNSWESYFASFATDVSNSQFYTSLFYALGLSEENYPTKQVIYKMFTAFKDFIMLHTYKNPLDVNMEFLPLEEQAFSSEKIENFELEVFFNKMIHRIAELDTVRHTQALPAKTPIRSSPLSIFSSVKALEPRAEGRGLLDKENPAWDLLGTSL